jgi:hypothetical protein
VIEGEEADEEGDVIPELSADFEKVGLAPVETTDSDEPVDVEDADTEEEAVVDDEEAELGAAAEIDDDAAGLEDLDAGLEDEETRPPRSRTRSSAATVPRCAAGPGILRICGLRAPLALVVVLGGCVDKAPPPLWPAPPPPSVATPITSTTPAVTDASAPVTGEPSRPTPTEVKVRPDKSSDPGPREPRCRSGAEGQPVAGASGAGPQVAGFLLPSRPERLC